ncbi:tetratricopeptide repeat protein [Actinoplanes sp. HUAS TT8]|uniref:tetratricopeptide repeat protein n=1 Tax=Actinoplanes sp. HUAS TT8 TaxID=3447453 RepID=UPI003F528D79
MAEVYRSVNAAGSVAAAENERGEMLRRAGRPGEAAGHFERALAALGLVGEPDPGTYSAILNNLALTAYQQGDLLRARRCLVRSLEVGPLVGDPVGRAITYDNLGVVEVELARAASGHGEPPADGARARGAESARARGTGRTRAEVHLGEAEGCFAAAERLFRSVLPEAVDDYLRSVLNRVDAAEIRGDAERMDRLTRHAAEVAAHQAVAPENALEAVTMRGSFLHRHRDRPRRAVELMTARLPGLLVDCPPEQSAAALVVLLAAAGATGDPALVQDVTARIAELSGDPATAPNKTATNKTATSRAAANRAAGSRAARAMSVTEQRGNGTKSAAKSGRPG